TSSGILFSNIGWKAVVKDATGKVLQEVYYKMGGNYLKTVDIRTAADGYEYALYQVSLQDFKSRLTDATKASLEAGKATVEFDACIIVKHNGVPGGAMTDAGVSWGKVYMTYNEIVNAEFWSADTQNNLKTYYDKEIEGLFYKITLTKDAGIESVKGAGTYCYGITVPISATPKSGYVFYRWTGGMTSESQSLMITINKNLSLKANSNKSNLTLTYKRNWDSRDTESMVLTLNVGNSSQKFLGRKWEMPGYHLTGWKEKATSLGADYALEETITSTWISNHLPSMTLYGNWQENQYTIDFDPNTVVNDKMQPMDVWYRDKKPVPECTYAKEVDAKFLGWSLSPQGEGLRLLEGEEISVQQLVTSLGLEYQNGGRITLYAIWDKLPSIDARDLYVSLKNANAGMVTEEYLLERAYAYDPEDGELRNMILMDYKASIYLEADKEGYVYETYRAKDKQGNSVEKTIRVFLVDTTVYRESEVYGELRFIDKDYLLEEDGSLVPYEEGGLHEKSRWRLEEDLLNKLKELLQ
ncbi:MAG: hypothetical protein J6R94_00415, partial [Agathobacter sp.]|nr:hypothetical protein [Agathobacter sp.]